MGLREDIPDLLAIYKGRQNYFAHNEILFNIYEGDLLSYILKDLSNQLSEKSFESVRHRIAPINVLKRLIEKLSKIYADPPKRMVVNGSDKDQALLEYYSEEMDINTVMTLGNEFFNLFKSSLIEPFLDNGVPSARTVPADRYFVHSKSDVNPLRPTHLVKIMGKRKVNGKDKMVFYAYTDQEFLPFDEDGQIVGSILADLNLDGGNVFGKIPAIYINRSRHLLTPLIDTDTLTMTKLIPILISDLNYAVMYQSFAIIYGIDVDDEDLKMAPNAFWRFKSDPTRQTNPQIGSIKPNVDIDQVLNLVKTEVGLWLQTRNVRPGAIGDLTPQNAASGISKMIDEMDTSEDRQKQVTYFINAEMDYWDLVLNHMHPVWRDDPEFQGPREVATPGIKVKPDFCDQAVIYDRGDEIDEEIKLMEKGLESRRGALKTLNPEWSDEQIDEKIKEIDEEKSEPVEESAPMPPKEELIPAV